MKILVTGAKGMLGTDLTALLSAGHQVMPTDIEEMDICRAEDVFSTIQGTVPDLVIHLAAMTDVDRCELEPDSAYLTNTVGTQNVALACRKVDAALVYMSTISVFDGAKDEPYTEFDTPKPRSVYSRSKYQGELLVQAQVPKHFIVRTGWLFGGGSRDKKFVAKIMALARTRPELRVVDDKFGSPTYTRDLAAGIERLIETELYGTYHMVNTGPFCSRLEFAAKIVELASIDDCKIVPVSSDEFPLPAPRPRMEAARNYHLTLMGLDLMRPWPDALKDYILALESGQL